MKRLLYLFVALLLIVPFYAESQEEKPAADLRRKGVQEEKKEEVGSLWTRELEVATGEEFFDDTRHDAYKITVYNLKNSKVEKYWKDEIKRNSDKMKGVKKKGVLSYVVDLPQITPEPLEVHAKTEDGITPNSSVFAVTFIKDGTEIGPETFPELHEKVEKMMYDLSVRMNKSVVREQLEEQQKILESLEKDLEKLKRDNEKLHDDIAKNTKRLEEAGLDQAKEEQEQEMLTKEIADYEAAMSENPSSDELKELSKLRKDLSKLERSVSKLKEDQIDYQHKIVEAEEAIPVNEQEQEAKAAEIENQKIVVEQYRKTLEDVQ